MEEFSILKYLEELRAAFFISSVTLAMFLFSIKSFIIQTLKKEIYDDDDYQKWQAKVLHGLKGSARERKGNDSYYGPLKRFSNLIGFAIYLSLINALLQVTIGFLDTACFAWICVIFTALVWIAFIFCMVTVSSNVSIMIDVSERKAREKGRND
jgi:hypothetical protein